MNTIRKSDALPHWAGSCTRQAGVSRVSPDTKRRWRYPKRPFTGTKLSSAMFWSVLGKSSIRWDIFRAQLPFTLTVTQALEISRENDDISLQACCHGSLGLAHGCIGEYQSAIANHERCLVLAVRMGDSKLEGISHCNLGSLFNMTGDYDKAIRSIEMGICMAKRVDDAPCQSRGYMSLGECFMHLQRYEEAIQTFELALPICLDINDDIGQAASHMQMGACYIFMAQAKQGTAGLDAVVKASDIFSRVLEIAENNPHHVVRNIRVQVYLEKAKLLYMQGNQDEALGWLERHLEMVVNMGRTLCMGCGQDAA